MIALRILIISFTTTLFAFTTVKAQDIFVKKFTGVNTNDFVFDKPYYIYKPSTDSFILNTIANFYSLDLPDDFLEENWNSVDDTSTYNQLLRSDDFYYKNILTVVYPKPDSSGHINGLFYYLACDSFVVAKGLLKNGKIHGVLLVNDFYENDGICYPKIRNPKTYLDSAAELFFYKNGTKIKETVYYTSSDKGTSSTSFCIHFPEEDIKNLSYSKLKSIDIDFGK